MTDVAREIGVGINGLRRAQEGYWANWQGGNQWSSSDSFISFFRHVVQLGLDYSGWEHWETLSLHSGPRFMHADFCIISDRPAVLTVDDQNRPHNDTGPFCRWRDGSALYAVHGVRVPRSVIENPSSITVDNIDSEQNTEVRRVMLERYGLARYIHDSRADLLDEDRDIYNRQRKLWRKEITGDEPLVMVEVINSTPEPDGHHKTYTLRVPPDMATAQQAVAWTFGMDAATYRTLVET